MAPSRPYDGCHDCLLAPDARAQAAAEGGEGEEGGGREGGVEDAGAGSRGSRSLSSKEEEEEEEEEEAPKVFLSFLFRSWTPL